MPREQSWSGQTPFVGREELLDQLMQQIDAAVGEVGRAIFLLGSPGSGKTALVGVLQEVAFRCHRELKAEYVNCAQSGERTWLELARLFTRGHRLKRSAWKVVMEWLDVTQIGAIFTAVWRTVKAVRTGKVGEDDERPGRSASDTAIEAVRMLVEYGALEPRLVILDSLERGDAEDLAGAFALIQRLAQTRTVLVASVRTKDGRPPPAIADLILEAERLGRSKRVELPALTLKELHEAVKRATHSAVPDEWLSWLAEASRCVPGALWSVLGRLERDGRLRRAGRGWSWQGSPDEGVGSAPQRTVDVSGLDDQDLRLLALAAVEGPVFHSTVIAELSGISELDLEDRFSRLCRVGVLEYRGEAGQGPEVMSEYAFRNAIDANVFAASYPEEERSGLSARIEEIKERFGLPSSEH